MSDLQILTKERLDNLINDTQVTLNELKDEVKRRETIKKETAISDLDNHMKSAELSLMSIKNFIGYLVNESKKR